VEIRPYLKPDLSFYVGRCRLFFNRPLLDDLLRCGPDIALSLGEELHRVTFLLSATRLATVIGRRASFFVQFARVVEFSNDLPGRQRVMAVRLGDPRDEALATTAPLLYALYLRASSE
jgi:hypothetical protein